MAGATLPEGTHAAGAKAGATALAGHMGAALHEGARAASTKAHGRERRWRREAEGDNDGMVGGGTGGYQHPGIGGGAGAHILIFAIVLEQHPPRDPDLPTTAADEKTQATAHFSGSGARIGQGAEGEQVELERRK